MSGSSNQKSFLQDLWERRFFQFFATYLGVCWGLIQFVEWLGKRYDLPSIYVDKLAVFLLLLLPFVISFIYIHGRKGHDRWLKYERIFYPINIVVALVCSLFLIKTSASTTEIVKIETLEGDTITREIPKAEYTKRVALFPMESSLGEDEDWRELSVNLLLQKDLNQDMRMIAISPTNMDSEFQDYDAEVLSVLPLAKAIKIAKDKYCDAFVTGSLGKKDNLFEVKTRLHSAKNGNVLSEVTLSSENMYGLVDQMSIHIQKQLNGEKIEAESANIDLPASGLITDKESALESYTKGSIAATKNINDLPTIISHLEKSTTEDNNCAECYSRLAQMQSLAGLPYQETMKKAMQNISSLPERQQLFIKYYNYFTQQQPDKAIKLLEIWRKLYPQDTNPYSNLVGYYNLTRQFDKAKEVAQDAIDNGHKAGMYLTLANLYLSTSDFDDAEKYVSLYEKNYPERATKKPVIAKVYSGKGDFEKALEIYEKQNLLDPNDLSVYIRIADIQSKQNKFDAAFSTLNEASSILETYNDTIQLITAEMSIFNRKGQIKAYYKKEAELEAVFMRHLPPAVYIQTFYQHLQNYGYVGDIVTLKSRLDKSRMSMPEQQQPLFSMINDYLYYMVAENTDSTDVAYARARDFLIKTNGPQMDPLAYGMIAYLKKDYQKAIDLFEEYLNLTGTADQLLDIYKSKSHRLLGQYEEGHNSLINAMTGDRLNPVFNLEKALLFADEGDKKKAKEHLKVALEVYKDADPEYRFKLEADALAKELGL